MPEITITSKRDGFRRCGVAHRDVPVTWPDGSFTEEQIAILRAEPALVVHTGAISGDDDKLKAALERIQELETQLEDVTTDRDRLQAALERIQELETQLEDVTTDRDRLQAALALQTASLSPEVKDNAADDTAAAESSAKTKK
ncbi:TPA: HI1506-related protein [Klebsiella pneumoniae]